MDVANNPMMNRAQLNNYYFSVNNIVNQLLPVIDLKAKEYTFDANGVSIVRAIYPYKKGLFIPQAQGKLGLQNPQPKVLFQAPINASYEFSFDLFPHKKDSPLTKSFDGITLIPLTAADDPDMNNKDNVTYKGRLLDLKKFKTKINLKTGMTVAMMFTASKKHNLKESLNEM